MMMFEIIQRLCYVYVSIDEKNKWVQSNGIRLSKESLTFLCSTSDKRPEDASRFNSRDTSSTTGRGSMKGEEAISVSMKMYND